LVICGVLIAVGAFVLLSRQSAPQTVPLERVEATPMRVPNESTDGPRPAPPPPPIKKAEPLEPRPSAPQPTPAVSPAPQPDPSPSSPATQTPAPPTPPATSPTPPAPAAPSSLPVRNSAQGWAVQAGAFRAEANATALRERLLRSGLAARVEPADDGIYRVLVGAYGSADAARAASEGVAAALR
jgi:cell division protein FtsN